MDARPSVAPDDERRATWPFWAPSARASVEAALDLADVGPGVGVLDLGCGDGQVLALVAERGGIPAGIEYDQELADEAATHLWDLGFEDVVVCGDLFDPDLELDADVWFAYLAPATLQRLVPRLTSIGGTLVTVDFTVPGLAPSATSGTATRYDLHPSATDRMPARTVGWAHAGTLIATVPDVQSLSCLECIHPAGPTQVRPTSGLAAAATVFAGADRLDRSGPLAVDLRWEDAPAGSFVGGTIRTAGAGSHAVFAVFGDDEGMWDLTDDAVARLRGALRRSRPPRTVDEALAIADG